MKTESIEEYLARGGKITVLKEVVTEHKQVMRESPASSPLSIISMEDAALYYGPQGDGDDEDAPKAGASVKETTFIDPSLIPEDLRDLLGTSQPVSDDDKAA